MFYFGYMICLFVLISQNTQKKNAHNQKITCGMGNSKAKEKEKKRNREEVLEEDLDVPKQWNSNNVIDFDFCFVVLSFAYNILHFSFHIQNPKSNSMNQKRF